MINYLINLEILYNKIFDLNFGEWGIIIYNYLINNLRYINWFNNEFDLNKFIYRYLIIN